MNESQRKTIEGWVEKASTQLQTAGEHLQSSYRHSEAIQAAQQCIELSVKSILSLLRVKYPKAHEWAAEKEPFATIARQIQERKLLEKLTAQHLNHIVPLQGCFFIMNFWGQFYFTAKYGFEAEYLASAQELFKAEEAQLAVHHAEECCRAASALRYYDKEKLTTLL